MPVNVWTCSALTHPLKAPLAASQILAYAWEAEGSRHVLYRAMDYQLHELWYKKNAWNHRPLTPLLNAPPAAMELCAIPGTMSAFYFDPRRQLQQISFENGQWNRQTIALPAIPPPESNLTGYRDGAGEINLIYRSADYQIHQLYSTQGTWHHYALGQHCNAPLSIGNPIASYWSTPGTEHVFYRGMDNRLHELRRQANGWDYQIIGQWLHLPFAAGDPGNYLVPWENAFYLLFRSADHQIHTLRCHEGLWTYLPLSSRTQAPEASSDPTGYVWVHDESQHIVYCGADRQIHELWIGKDQWHHHAIGKEARSALATGRPVAYVWEKGFAQYVVYRGLDGNIYELQQQKKTRSAG